MASSSTSEEQSENLNMRAIVRLKTDLTSVLDLSGVEKQVKEGNGGR